MNISIQAGLRSQRCRARRLIIDSRVPLLLLLASAGCWSSFSIAAEVAGHDVEHVSFEGYQALAQADEEIDTQKDSAGSQFNYYLGQSGNPSLRINHVEIQIDDGDKISVDLSSAAATALAEYSELRRIARLTTEPGDHKIRVDVIIWEPSKPTDPTSVVTGEARLLDSTKNVNLALTLESGLVGKPKLRLVELVSGDSGMFSGLARELMQVSSATVAKRQYRIGSEQDPALSHIKSLEHSHEQVSALIELLRQVDRNESGTPVSTSYLMEEIQLMRELSLTHEAERICDQLAERGDASSAVATERLRLAEALLSAGDAEAAENQLQRADAALPDLLRSDWRYVYGRALISQRRPKEAIALIKDIDQTAEAYRFIYASSDALRATAYNQFNLAVAMIRSGDEQRGLSWLDLIGRSRSTDPEMMDLRDKANLEMGWHFLKAKQGRTALGALGRVRTEGPLSNAALLGMGWAELSPAGKRLSRDALSYSDAGQSRQSSLTAPLTSSLARIGVLEPELNSGLGPASFTRDDVAEDRTENLRRALSVWKVLATHDVRDPSVQEGMLAVAYAYDQLHETAAARDAYDQAISLLRDVRGKIDGAKEFIGRGALSAAMSDTADEVSLFEAMDRLSLPPDDSTASLYEMLDFYRSIVELKKIVEKCATDVSNILSSKSESSASLVRLHSSLGLLSEYETEMEQRIQAIALDKLALRRDGIDEYLQSALLLSARIEDQPSLALRQGG